jgi:hypothetical protein
MSPWFIFLVHASGVAHRSAPAFTASAVRRQQGHQFNGSLVFDNSLSSLDVFRGRGYGKQRTRSVRKLDREFGEEQRPSVFLNPVVNSRPIRDRYRVSSPCTRTTHRCVADGVRCRRQVRRFTEGVGVGLPERRGLHIHLDRPVVTGLLKLATGHGQDGGVAAKAWKATLGFLNA